jgi:hypothetical protein
MLPPPPENWVQFPKVGSPNPIRYQVAGLKSSVTVPVAIVMGRLCFIVLAALLVFIMGLSVINNRNRDGYATF